MAYSLETSSVKTIVPGAEVSGFCDVVARQKINEVSGEVPQLSAGEGIAITTADGKTVITNNISAGENISVVYDMETNTYRIDGQGGVDPASAVLSESAIMPTLGLSYWSGVKISGGNETLYHKTVASYNTYISAVSLDGPYVTYLTGDSDVPTDLHPVTSEHWNNIITSTKEVSDKSWNWNSTFNTVKTNSAQWSNIKLLSTGYRSGYPSDASYYYSAMLVDGIVQLRLQNNQPGGGAGFGNTGYFSATYTNGGVDLSSVRIFNDTAQYPTVTAASSLNWVDCIDVNNTVQTNSASWANAGHTYTGVAPIQVNNTTDEISITGESLSAGPGIDMFSSGGYVVVSSTGKELSAGPGIDLFESGGYFVISGNGGNAFPITGTNGTTGFTANMDCSSMMLTTGASPAGGYVKQTTRGVQYEAYPATDVSASWYNIITATNNRSNCYCIKLNSTNTAASLEDYSAYDRVTVIHAQDYGPDYLLHWDGKTKTFPSGLYCELAKVKNDENEDKWTFLNSGWSFDFWWDYD